MGTHPIFESDFDCLTEMNEAEHGYYKRFFQWIDNDGKPTNTYGRLKVKWFIKQGDACPMYTGKVSANVQVSFRTSFHHLIHTKMLKLMDEGKMTREQFEKMNKCFHKIPFKVREMLKNHLKKTNLEFLREKLKQEEAALEECKNTEKTLVGAIRQIKEQCNRSLGWF